MSNKTIFSLLIRASSLPDFALMIPGESLDHDSPWFDKLVTGNRINE